VRARALKFGRFESQLGSESGDQDLRTFRRRRARKAKPMREPIMAPRKGPTRKPAGSFGAHSARRRF